MLVVVKKATRRRKERERDAFVKKIVRELRAR